MIHKLLECTSAFHGEKRIFETGGLFFPGGVYSSLWFFDFHLQTKLNLQC